MPPDSAEKLRATIKMLVHLQKVNDLLLISRDSLDLSITNLLAVLEVERTEDIDKTTDDSTNTPDPSDRYVYVDHDGTQH